MKTVSLAFIVLLLSTIAMVTSSLSGGYTKLSEEEFTDLLDDEDFSEIMEVAENHV